MSVKKWEKYKILFKYGLATEDEISKQIRRYKKKEVHKMCNELSNNLAQGNPTDIYIIKLVPKQLRFKLKNFKLRSPDDLIPFLNEVKTNKQIEEIWYCKNRLDPNRNCVYGRLYINNSGTHVNQYIEQVWADTARKIEEITHNQQITYVRAKRLNWGWRYFIEHINCEKNSKDIILNDFWECAKQIEARKEQIQNLADDLFRLGIYSFDIEYKIINGCLSFIDWDTANDMAVLENLL